MNKMVLTVGATLTAFAALAAEKLPTDYGDPANDILSGSVDGLTWQGAARAYKIENDVVLVFTDTTAGNCSFTLAAGYQANGRYLLVGGGGPGGNSTDMGMEGGGGGAGGFVEASNVSFDSGDYSLFVGAGGEPKGWKDDGVDLNQNNNGKPSYISYGGADFDRALGGGGGGIPTGSRNDNGWKHAAGHPYGYASNDKVGSNYDYSKVDVACGGGGAGWANWGYWQNAPDSPAGRGGWVNQDQGNNGGNGTSSPNAAGGGGGAGEAGKNTESGSISGAGGAGLPSDITGEEVWYAGGGAGGSYGSWGTASARGGVGGGGDSGADSYNQPNKAWSDSGTDGLGGGGAGCSGAVGASSMYGAAGRGGSGVVIVRFSKVEKPVPVEGFDFSGETEWFNIGEGDEKETVVVFKNVDVEGSFTLARDANARILLVGGGGPGGNHNQGQVLGGGGAGGGVVDVDYADYYAGTYTVNVGKGGIANGDYNNPVFNNNGAPSFIRRGGSDVLLALGGGGGGVPNNSGNWKVACGNPYGYCTNDNDTEYDFSKVDVANGGGAAICGGPGWCDAQHPGKVGDLGYEGGKAVKCGNTFEALLNAGGGAGAGENGHDATGYGASGAGGNGKQSDITGIKTYYGGGGAGGTFGAGSGVTALVSGGLGGGGKAYVDDSKGEHVFAENGVDGLGGGGAGASLSGGTSPRTKAFAGRGGNGVVIVRVKKVYPAEEALPGVSFEGAAEWYNLGHGKTRETVIIYTNVNEVGKLTLGRRARARVLLVAGGGAGGYGGGAEQVGGGGGAGGMLTNEYAGTWLRRGEYAIAVGKGGLPSSNNNTKGQNGGDSTICLGANDVFRAKGGGAGGNVNGDWMEQIARGSIGGSGGGGGGMWGDGWSRPSVAGGAGTEGQGYAGGKSAGSWTNAGGGGGAGEAGGDAPGSDVSGRGGNGMPCDISGVETWYAGGGAGGAYGAWRQAVIVGGDGGGGKSEVDGYDLSCCISYNGEDGLGGGGAGSCGCKNNNGFLIGAPGRGGNGVVIVRITEVTPVGMTVIIH